MSAHPQRASRESLPSMQMSNHSVSPSVVSSKYALHKHQTQHTQAAHDDVGRWTGSKVDPGQHRQQDSTRDGLKKQALKPKTGATRFSIARSRRWNYIVSTIVHSVQGQA